MKDLMAVINTSICGAFSKAFNGEYVDDVSGMLTNGGGVVPSTNPRFGDYQCNLPMMIAKKMGKNPRDIAHSIIENIALPNGIEPPSIAGPGFINFAVNKAYLEESIKTLTTDDRLGVALCSPAEKVILEYSSPNIAKEMHVGHLRSTIIGESLARVFEFAGHDVLRLNHVGDWGTQFGMLIAYLKEACPQALTAKDAIDLGDLVAFYRKAKARFDADAQFAETARLEVVKLQSGEKESLAAWNLLIEQSRRDFSEIYGVLDVNLQERGESFYNPMLLDVVQDLEKSSLAIEDQGAKVVKLNEFKSKEGEPLGVIVQKKDGGFIYATTDLAGIRYRVNHDKATLIVYVVDAGQSDHFAQVFQVARLASWVPDNVRLVHVPFGVVQGEDGKKLKTRSGDNVRLRDLLDEAVTRAKLDLERRLHEEEREEPEEFKAQVARTVGIAAVKYADLSQNRMTNYIFSFDKMLSFHGNTAPYLLYAYVRVKGIERKGNIDTKAAQSKVNIQLTEPTEIELAKHLLRFDETIDTVMRDFAPNRICDYLFELSQKFNQFYEQCAVLNAPEVERVSRIALCEITARILKQGLYLLGIPVLERM